MRYGIIRHSSALPPGIYQRRAADLLECDFILDEGEPSRDGQRRLLRLLDGLKPGDEVVLHSLDALELTTGELVRVLYRFFQVGVAVIFTGGVGGDGIHPGVMPKVLSLLAEYESRHPSKPPVQRRSRAGRKALTRYQIDYARKLMREGASARSVGLLFQVAPSEVLDLVDG